MKMHLNVDLKKLLTEMRGPKGAAALTEEYDRISTELKKMSDEVKPQAKAQLKRYYCRSISRLKGQYLLIKPILVRLIQQNYVARLVIFPRTYNC